MLPLGKYPSSGVVDLCVIGVFDFIQDIQTIFLSEYTFYRMLKICGSQEFSRETGPIGRCVCVCRERD